jgi:hypothetical protein
MRDTIDMARKVYGAHTEWTGAPLDRLEQLVALVRADEQEKYKWDIHSCGPTCKRYACVAMREAVEAEREACARVCDEYSATGKIDEFDRGWLACAKNTAAAIRARGQA